MRKRPCAEYATNGGYKAKIMVLIRMRDFSVNISFTKK
jgi:hypothetical protein